MVMPSTKRRIDGEDKSPFTLSFRFSKDLVNKITTRWSEEGFANRTALVEAACNFYFDTQACPRCGNRNHKNSLYCSICGNTLNPLYELKEELDSQFLSIKKHQENIIAFEKQLLDERAKITERILSMHLDKNLELNLLDMIHNLASLEDIGALEIALKNSEGNVSFYPNSITHPLFSRYSEIIEKVTKFFESPAYITNNPPLSIEQVNEIKSDMSDLEDTLNHYLLNVLGTDKMVYKSIHAILDCLSQADPCS